MRNHRQPDRPAVVSASAGLMLLGAVLSIIWAIGATQQWWVASAGLSLPQEANDRLTEANLQGWTGSEEDIRRMTNGTTLVLACVGTAMWVTGAVVTYRGGVPNRSIVVTLCVLGLLVLGGTALGGGVGTTQAAHLLAFAMVSVGVVATGLLFLPAATRWFESFTMYRPVLDVTG